MELAFFQHKLVSYSAILHLPLHQGHKNPWSQIDAVYGLLESFHMWIGCGWVEIIQAVPKSHCDDEIWVQLGPMWEIPIWQTATLSNLVMVSTFHHLGDVHRIGSKVGSFSAATASATVALQQARLIPWTAGQSADFGFTGGQQRKDPFQNSRSRSHSEGPYGPWLFQVEWTVSILLPMFSFPKHHQTPILLESARACGHGNLARRATSNCLTSRYWQLFTTTPTFT